MSSPFVSLGKDFLKHPVLIIFYTHSTPSFRVDYKRTITPQNGSFKQGKITTNMAISLNCMRSFKIAPSFFLLDSITGEN